jgi:hypothetical protein
MMAGHELLSACAMTYSLDFLGPQSSHSKVRSSIPVRLGAVDQRIEPLRLLDKFGNARTSYLASQSFSLYDFPRCSRGLCQESEQA